MKYDTILETIGHTPHVKINRLFGTNHNVWIKLERANPGASIKDRIALSMIEDAEKKGLLKKTASLSKRPREIPELV
jgi:cysteine synthase A